MNKQDLLFLQLLVVSWSCGLAQDGPCWQGQRLHKSADPNTRNICLPCEEGTYMGEKEHWNEKCNKCSEKISDLEVVVRACNITHDTEIQCVSGHYRRRAQTALDKDACVECRRRESGFPARPCQGYNDTVCCPLLHDAVWTCEGKYECQERTACDAGMYYNTSVGVCLSCPNGTYMQLNTHSATECFKCEVLSANRSNNAVILHNCTRDSPTIFGCKDFHFRASDSGFLLKEAPCWPCQNCSRYLRQCQILNDAVCAEDSHGDDNTTGYEQTTNVPESPPTQTSSYQTNIVLFSEMLLYVILIPVVHFKHFYTPGEGYQLRRILAKVLGLYRDYYFSLFIVSILFHLAIFICEYFNLFARYDIFSTLTVVLGFIAFIFILFKCLSDNSPIWDIICSGKRRGQTSVNRFLSARKSRSDAIPGPQAESFIYVPQSPTKVQPSEKRVK